MSEIDDVCKGAEQRMGKAIEATRNDFASVRTGRASPALLDRLHVEAYGAEVPLKQVATVSTPDARTLQIAAFDRNTVGSIRKAIETSDLGLTPNIDGSNIRHKSVDEAKHLLKDGKLTEDENKRAADRIQKLTDKFIKDVDALVAVKEKEIMEV